MGELSAFRLDLKIIDRINEKKALRPDPIFFKLLAPMAAPGLGCLRICRSNPYLY
jgi:hypothetical protein